MTQSMIFKHEAFVRIVRFATMKLRGSIPIAERLRGQWVRVLAEAENCPNKFGKGVTLTTAL